MTLKERKKIAEEWIKYQEKDFRVIIHIGTSSSRQSQELAKHAQKIFADGISSMSPIFYKPNSIDNLVQFCSEIASAAPEQNFYYYHIPSFTGVDYSMVDFIKCASERIRNFSGIKYTHDNLNEMKECITINKGNLRIFHGKDEMLLKGLYQGVESAVGSTYNFMPSIYLCLIENYFKGNKERAEFKQSQANEITNILFKYGGPIIAGKVIMKLIGIDLGSCRQPLSNLTPEAVENLEKDLVAANFFEKI